jgi:universal stress protein A
MWKKLLVPHEFSPCADRALQIAVELTRVHRAELVLLHVSELPANLPPDLLVTPADAPGPVRVDTYTTHGAAQRLERIAEPLRREGLAVGTLAVTGTVPDRVLALTGELGVSAVVVGTHGRSGVSHLLLGSVAEKIVRNAAVPVVCVRTHGKATPPTREESNVEDELAG